MRPAIRGDRDKDGLATLLAEVASGDKSAFAKLYGLTSRKLFGVALRILRDRAAAEDIVQEVYVRIWRNAASFDLKLASPIAWMASCAPLRDRHAAQAKARDDGILRRECARRGRGDRSD
jgi:RNA polymerase sigma-70 factor (ECF subfamily)